MVNRSKRVGAWGDIRVQEEAEEAKAENGGQNQLNLLTIYLS